MKINIIGLAGQRGVGKTAVSLLLLKFFPAYHRASFGDLVRQEVGAKFQVRMETLYHNLDDYIDLNEERERAGMPQGMAANRLVEWYAQEIIQPKNPNHWVMVMGKWLKLCQERNVPGMIIDDISFPNEANLVKRRRGLLVKLEPYAGYTPPLGDSSQRDGAELSGYKGFHCIFSPEYGEGALEDLAKTIAEHHGRMAL